MKPIHEMTVEEKLAAIEAGREHRLGASLYKSALLENNQTVIAEAESFIPEGEANNWWTVERMLLCYHEYLAAHNGFRFRREEITFTKELILNIPFSDVEEILFPVSKKESHYFTNRITLGQGHGTWTYGCHFTQPYGGLYSGLTVFRFCSRNKAEVLAAALEALILFHEESMEFHKNIASVHKICSAVIKQAQDKLDVLTGKKIVQLSLF